MVPSRKRSYAASKLDNVTPNRSKRQKPPPDIFILSSDSEVELVEPPTSRATGSGILTDDGIRQRSMSIPRTFSVLEQLQLDAFCDFKADICCELDALRETEIDESDCESAVSDGDRENEDNVDTLPAEDIPLRDLLQRWVEQDKTARLTDHLYYRLDSRYDQKDFPPKTFRRRNRVVVETLGRICRDLSLEVFVALLDRNDSDSSPSYLVSGLFGLQGERLVSDYPLDERNWLHAKLSLSHATPSQSEVAVVLVPRDSAVDFLIPHASLTGGLFDTSGRATTHVGHLVLYYITRLQEQKPGCSRVLPVFRELCTRIWGIDEAMGLAVLPAPFPERILMALICARDWAFLEEATRHVGPDPLQEFFPWVAKLVQRGDLAVGDIEKGLLNTVLACHTASYRVAAANDLLGLRAKGGEDFLRQLTIAITEDIHAHPSSFVDGYCLGPLIDTVLGREALTSKLLPAVERNSSRSSFGFGVLGSLEELRSGDPSATILRSLYERFAILVIDALDVSKLSSAPSRSREPICACSNSLSRNSTFSNTVAASQLAISVSNFLAEELHDSVFARFALKVVGSAALIPLREFVRLWLPFLGRLVKALEEKPTPLSSPRYHHLFAGIIEAYLTRCVGSPPMKWAPDFRSLPCRCRICILVNRFLASSASAATFTSVSEQEVQHINAYLLCLEVRISCKFTVENGQVVVRKQEKIDSQAWSKWIENKSKATTELSKLDGPGMRTILGDDYARLFDFDAAQLQKKTVPVPMESLTECSEDPETQPLNSGSEDLSRQTVNPGGLGGHPATPASVGRPGLTRNTPSNARGYGPLSPPTTVPSTRPGTSAGYSLFASELGALLSKLSSFTTPESIHSAIVNRWAALSDRERRRCDARAVKRQQVSSAPASSTSVPFSLQQSQLPSTPQPTPQQGPFPPSSSALSGPANPRSGKTTPKCKWRGSRSSFSTPTPQPSVGVTSSPLSRAFGPVSSSRLNSMPQPQSQPKVKTELLPQTTPWGQPKIKSEPQSRAALRVALRKVVEVIDLTGNSD